MPKSTVGAKIEQEEKAKLIERADKLNTNVNQLLKKMIHRFNRKELNEEEIVSDEDLNPSSYKKKTENDIFEKLNGLEDKINGVSNSKKSKKSNKKSAKDMEVHEISPEDLTVESEKSKKSGSKGESKEIATKDDLNGMKKELLEAMEVKPEDLKKGEPKKGKGLYECLNCGYKRTGKFNKCPKCSTELEWKEDWKEEPYECGNCGYKEESKFDKCPNCGTEIKEWKK